MNPNEEQPTLTKDQIVNLGVKNLLTKNTNERNDAIGKNEYLNRQLQTEKNSKNEQYFKLMGRIVKYEPTAFDEILPYAFENGCFWECDSKDLDIYSQIKDYTTKTTNKTYKAHFTIYNKFIQKCKTENEAPISYKGYFLMKNYQDKFELDKTKDEYKTLQDFIKIKSVEPVIIPEPQPAYIQVETPKFTDGGLISDWDEINLAGTLIAKKYENTIYIKPNPKCYLETENNELKFLHPRIYLDYYHQIYTNFNDWVNKDTEVYFNKETQDKIYIKKDYDTTPKRKLAKNKIWAVNFKAVNFISAFGYTKLE